MGKFFFAQSRYSSGLRLLRNFTPRTRFVNESLFYHCPSTRSATPSPFTVLLPPFASQRLYHTSSTAKMTEITHATIQGTSSLLFVSLPLHRDPTINFSPRSDMFKQQRICSRTQLASRAANKDNVPLELIRHMACPVSFLAHQIRRVVLVHTGPACAISNLRDSGGE